MKRSFLKLFLAFNLALILSFFLIIPGFAEDETETLTITTYYPAPFGVYNELRTKRMAIGDTYYDASQHPWDEDGMIDPGEIAQDLDLVVEGKVAIGKTEPPLNDLTIYRTGPASIGLDSGDDTKQTFINLVTKGDISPGDRTSPPPAHMSLWHIVAKGDKYPQANEPNNLKLDYWNGTKWIETLILKSDGNVGIGTIDPQAKLEVKGGVIKATDGLVIEVREDAPPADELVPGRIWLQSKLEK